MRKVKFSHENIKSVIKRAGVSQRDIADRLSLSENQVSRFLAKQVTFKEHIEVIADMCRVTVDDLLAGNYEPGKAKAPPPDVSAVERMFKVLESKEMHIRDLMEMIKAQQDRIAELEKMVSLDFRERGCTGTKDPR